MRNQRPGVCLAFAGKVSLAFFLKHGVNYCHKMPAVVEVSISSLVVEFADGCGVDVNGS